MLNSGLLVATLISIYCPC
uniref:Uncharacterized protein n=1 Tax=Arundo donax TaxID=35708 RepID=A0A0A8YEK8_ARUDO